MSIDLGASNGRAIIGSFDGRSLSLREAHRFANGSVPYAGGLYWDFTSIYKEVLQCVEAAAKLTGAIRSLAVDGWSQDFGLLDGRGNLLGNPRHYRDPRTADIHMKIFGIMPAAELFAITGKPPASVSTLFQLASMHPEELERARTLLFMPNLLLHRLSGEIHCDSSLAAASQLYDARSQDWSRRILEAFGLSDMLPKIAEPGRLIGRTLPHVFSPPGQAGGIPVHSVAQHDTVSALLAADPGRRPGTVTVICGTWSVCGITHDSPIMDERMLSGGFNNEPGYYGDGMHIVKYMTGMWLLQECRKEWLAQGLDAGYARLQAGASASRCDALIDIEHAMFAAPGYMCEKIAAHCRATGQSVPQDEFDMYRCIVNGLAAAFARTIEEIGQAAGRKPDEIRMVGGGSRDPLLCALTAKHAGLPVIGGLYEASAIGNVLVQLISIGELGGLGEANEMIESSFERYVYYPD